MNFYISDTFIDSLAKLTADEQKAAKTTAFDLHMNPANPGLSFHQLDKARDKNFWSVRVSRDIRLIVHKTAASLLLCYVDHHDKAYHWAERRKLETHPQTGAAQLVEIRETVQEVIVPKFVEVKPGSLPKPRLFAHITKDILLSYGVPEEWLSDVQSADEDSLLDVAVHLPAEAADALLVLATGGQPRVAPPIALGTDPFLHFDAQQRFLLIENSLVENREMFLSALKFVKPIAEMLKGPKDNFHDFLENTAELGRTARRLYLREVHEGKREANFNDLRQLEMHIEVVEKGLETMRLTL